MTRLARIGRRFCSVENRPRWRYRPPGKGGQSAFLRGKKVTVPGGRRTHNMVFSRARRFLPAAFVVWMTLHCTPAWAKLEGAIEDWGLGGAVKAGSWCPLYLELRSTHEDFRGFLEVEVEAGQDTIPLFVKALDLPADTLTRHWVYFRTPVSLYKDPAYRFHWRVRDMRDRVRLRREWGRNVVASAGDTVIAVMRTAGVDRAGLAGLLKTDASVRTQPLRVSPQLAPDRSMGYASADAIVWINPNPSAFVITEQADAIVDYVREGGHLVIAVADGWQAVAQSFLGGMSPAELTGSTLVSGPAGLGEYGATSEAIVLARMENVTGEVLMKSRGAPVIVRGDFGLGRVTLIGFDPTRAPFADLDLKEAFWGDILGIETEVPEEEHHSKESVSGALIRPLNDFPGFKPINFLFVGIFLAVYVILIGPVDYLVLKRLKKMHWTWITFPAIAIGASVLAFLALSTGRVTGLQGNSISVVTASADCEEISGLTFATVLSPSQTRYSVEIDGGRGSVAPREFDPLMQMPGGGAGFGSSECYVSQAGRRIDKLLIRLWSAQTFEASWRAPTPALPRVVLSADASGGLSGEVINDTPYTLEEATIIHGDSVWRLEGRILPEKSVEVRAEGRRQRRLVQYVNQLRSSVQGPRHSGRGMMGEDSVSRSAADAAARWVSLFGFSQGEGKRGRFCRRWAEENSYSETIYDLPRSIEISDWLTEDQAILLFSVDHAYANIALSGWEPAFWNRTVVRMRVPVTVARNVEGDAS